jgi:hypothetical protein
MNLDHWITIAGITTCAAAAFAIRFGAVTCGAQRRRDRE